MTTPRVTLHVWRVPARRLPRVLWRLARDRSALRRVEGVAFAKLLGTGRAGWFGPTRADPTRWAALVVSRGGPDLAATRVGRAWRALATSYCRLELRTLSARGRWAGTEPFRPHQPTEAAGPVANLPATRPTPRDDPRLSGLVLAITRARLRVSRAGAFWRAIAPVGAAAHRAPGLIMAFGVGEAPLGWQGTISLWRAQHDLVEFAYRHPDHRRAIEETAVQGWYAEELFARFAVVTMTGDRELIGYDEAGDAEHDEKEPP